MKLCKGIQTFKRCSNQNNMEKINLKKIMTDLAAGHITKKEADILIKEGKVQPHRSKTKKKNILKTNGGSK